MSIDAPNYFAGLGHRAAALRRIPPAAQRAAGLSKIDAMRQAMEEQGALSARELAAVAGLHSTALVGALLKNDLAKGRVRYRDGRYQLVGDYEPDVLAAIALLRRQGFTVLAPAASATSTNTTATNREPAHG